MTFFKKLFKNFKGSSNDFLVLDLGTSLRLAQVRVIASEKKVVILALGESKFNPNEPFTNLEMLVSSVGEALRSLRPLGYRRPDRLVIFLNSNILKGKSFTVSRQRVSPDKKIDMVEFKSILERVEWQALEAIRRYYATRETGQSPKIIEANLTHLSIDGYEVSSPLRLKGQTVMLKIFNYFLTRQQYSVLVGLAKKLELNLAGIISSTRAQVLSQINANTIKSGFIFIDVGDNNTDIAVFKDGQLQGIENFDLGGSLFIKAIQNEFSVDVTEAEKIETSYQVGTLDDDSVRKLERRVKKDVEVLRNGVLLTLDNFRTLKPLPNLILLSGGGARFGLVKKMLGQASWYKGFPMRGRARVKVLVPADLSNVVDETQKLLGPESVPIMASANYLNEGITKSQEIDQVLTRIVKMSDN